MVIALTNRLIRNNTLNREKEHISSQIEFFAYFCITVTLIDRVFCKLKIRFKYKRNGIQGLMPGKYYKSRRLLRDFFEESYVTPHNEAIILCFFFLFRIDLFFFTMRLHACYYMGKHGYFSQNHIFNRLNVLNCIHS